MCSEPAFCDRNLKRARVLVVDAPFSVSVAQHLGTANMTGQRLSEEADTMMVSSVVKNLRDSQTIVCHLPAEELCSGCLVFGP